MPGWRNLRRSPSASLLRMEAGPEGWEWEVQVEGLLCTAL